VAEPNDWRNFHFLAQIWRFWQQPLFESRSDFAPMLESLGWRRISPRSN